MQDLTSFLATSDLEPFTLVQPNNVKQSSKPRKKNDPSTFHTNCFFKVHEKPHLFLTFLPSFFQTFSIFLPKNQLFLSFFPTKKNPPLLSLLFSATSARPIPSLPRSVAAPWPTLPAALGSSRPSSSAAAQSSSRSSSRASSDRGWGTWPWEMLEKVEKETW